MNGMNKKIICPIEPVNNAQTVSYGYVNPYTGLYLNPVVADRIYMDSLKYQAEKEKQMVDYACKKDLEMLKAENRFRLEEKQEENRVRRIEGMQARTDEQENASYAIFKDSEKRLCLETKYPTRKSDYSKPVINSADMRAYRICDMETHKTVAVIMDADNLTEEIVLVRADINPRVFERCLSKCGLAITTSRERRKMVVELLLSYLIDKATVVELPKTVGWTQTDMGWIFAASDAETIEGVLKGRYEIK